MCWFVCALWGPQHLSILVMNACCLSRVTCSCHLLNGLRLLCCLLSLLLLFPINSSTCSQGSTAAEQRCVVRGHAALCLAGCVLQLCWQGFHDRPLIQEPDGHTQ